MITEDYVSFETAKLLKEKGFNERCTHYYKNEKYLVDLGYSNILYYTNSDLVEEFAAPTLQMAMKWLREVHNIQIWFKPNIHHEGMYNMHVMSKWKINVWDGYYSSYEEGCEAAIKYCLENFV